MNIFVHELKRGRTALIVWSAILSFMLGVCILIYPEMSSQMNELSDMFADMGSFSAAFGMDQLNFGEFIGYFGVECGNTLGLGGSFFAAIIGVSALAKEEKDKTAEFLLTQPVSRTRIVAEKLLAVVVQILLLNIVVFAVTLGTTQLVGVTFEYKPLVLMLLAYFILQVEIAAITFGISAFIKNSGFAIGLGVSVLFYFLNIVANLSEKSEFLKYITPFAFADSADIIANEAIDAVYLSIGIAIAVLSIAAAFIKYSKKDIS